MLVQNSHMPVTRIELDTKIMVRPREFDANDALEQAMQVFWDKGYQSTSLNALTRAMSISKSSFYEAFGSKHELYLSRLNTTTPRCPVASPPI